jgi:lipoate-protein ligase A
MNKQWRLILDGKCDGYYNMAVDEAILSNYPQAKIPTLRLYGWKKPFVSLGYNQNPQDFLNSDEDIPFVRRITGGAAILHDQELTYSLCCSLKDLNLPSAVKESYRIICSFLKYFYKNLGIEVNFAKDIFSKNSDRHSNFCFEGYESFDLVTGGRKIGGNAQRRKKDLIFQHGSIPQNIDFTVVKKIIKNTNEFKARAASVDDILQKTTDFNVLSNILADSFKDIFKIILIKADLFQEEKEIAQFLLKTKYCNDEWNFCRKKILDAKTRVA